jgi:MazG family protein
MPVPAPPALTYPTPLSASDAAAYHELRHGSAWFEWADQWSTFRGPKAADALNGLVTNEVTSLAPGQGQYATALTPKGKVLCDMLIVRTDEETFLLALPPACAPAWLATARKYVNPRLAKVEDAAEQWATWMLYGAQAAQTLAALSGADHTIEELGDVLLQIVLHAEMLSESGASDFNKLSFNLAAKIRLRHPHVFDAKFGRFKSADEVSAAWESIKAYGRSKTASKSKPGDRSKRPSNFDRMFQDVPAQMPGLSRAARLGEKAATLGFDWPKAEDVLDKINEEFQELKSSLNDEKEGPKELGDLLFAAAQLARLKGWDPEAALRSCERKFVERLGLMNQELQSQNKDWHSQSLVELESLWQKTKKLTPNT